MTKRIELRPLVKKARKARAADWLEEGSRYIDLGKDRKAFTSFQAGARLGDADCQLSLGYCYDNGIGTTRNIEKALHWYRLAWRKGSAPAANNIGTVYRDQGDLLQATEWFLKAISAGDDGARLEISKMWINQARDHLKAASSKATFLSEQEREEIAKLRKMLQS